MTVIDGAIILPGAGGQRVSDKQLAIVIACDDGYFFHCRNLLASMAKNAPSMLAVDRYCVSPGLSDEHQAELAQFGVHYVPKGLDIFSDTLADIVRRHPYTFGQFVRPLFPKIIPGYQSYLYMDCDTWVQNDTLIPVIQNALMFSAHNVVAAPLVSHYYPTVVSDLKGVWSINENWVYGTYELRFARALATRAFFSSGVFAIAGQSPFWDIWWQDILQIAPSMDKCSPTFMHFAEQTAFNGVLARTGMTTVLDPLYNFHCNLGGIMREATGGTVLSVMAKPAREVCVIHLAAWSTLKDDYIKSRLTFEP